MRALTTLEASPGLLDADAQGGSEPSASDGDVEAVVAAAEVGGRDYLQLSDSSDASLQVRMVQWYPGHIARAERQLKAQLGMVDVVLEVRDARIPVSTHHPQVASWVGSKPRLLLINRADEVAPADLAAWRGHYEAAGARVFWTDGRSGDGVQAVRRELLKVAGGLNAKRAKRGLQPRAVRACVIGFPNIGKSALINRLVKRRAVESAPKPGVTRALRWVRVDEQLDLLDAPGVIPAAFRDQLAAQRLAMCNDIGEAAYLASAVGAALVLRVKQLAAADAEADAEAAKEAVKAKEAAEARAGGDDAGAEEAEAVVPRRRQRGGRGAGGGGSTTTAAAAAAARGTSGRAAGVMAGVLEAMRRRYGVDPLTAGSAEDFLVALADRQFGGDVERAGLRLLNDYRSGSLGAFALERPGDLARRQRREAGLQAAADLRQRDKAGDGADGASDGEGASAAASSSSFDDYYPLSSGDGGGDWAGSGPLEGFGGATRADSGPWGWGDGAAAGGGGGSGSGSGFGAPLANSSWVEQAEAWERQQTGPGADTGAGSGAGAGQA